MKIKRKRYDARLGLKAKIAYTKRSDWTLRLVQLALRQMEKEYEAQGIPKAERAFRTSEIERTTKKLDPNKPEKPGREKAGVHRSTYGKNLDIASAIAEARGAPPPSLPDFKAYANEWVQPDPAPETLVKRRSHLFRTYMKNELAERRVALGELLHHLEERRSLLEKFKFDDRVEKPYPNPPFQPRVQAMELYLHLRTVGQKRELALEIANLEEKIAIQRAHVQAHDLRYTQQMRKVFLTSSQPAKRGAGKSAADVADASAGAE